MTQPERGDLLKVRWLDITTDETGDPDTAKPAVRVSYGLFWAHEPRGGADCLVTTTTLDEHDVTAQQGYCVYPYGVVIHLEVIKRARRARRGKKAQPPPDGGAVTT